MISRREARSRPIARSGGGGYAASGDTGHGGAMIAGKKRSAPCDALRLRICLLFSLIHRGERAVRSCAHDLVIRSADHQQLVIRDGVRIERGIQIGNRVTIVYHNGPACQFQISLF